MDVLADLVDVAVHHENVQSDADQRFNEVGTPRFHLSSSGDRVVLDVELRYDPRVWPAEADSVRARLQKRFGDEVQIALHGQGRLPDTPVFA